MTIKTQERLVNQAPVGKEPSVLDACMYVLLVSFPSSP